MALTKAEKALLAKLGIGEDVVTKAATANAKKALQEKARDLLTEPLTEIIADVTVTESAKTAWVGATLTFELDGYGVKVVLTDKAATKAREQVLKSA